MALQVTISGDEVTVKESGHSPLLRIRLEQRMRGGALCEELTVTTSTCLCGDFDASEAQARAYVEAFELARRVLTPNSGNDRNGTNTEPNEQ